MMLYAIIASVACVTYTYLGILILLFGSNPNFTTIPVLWIVAIYYAIIRLD